MEISSDKTLNPELQKEMKCMRQGIVEAANMTSLPSRFTVEPHPDKPHMYLTDTTSGKTVSIPLFAYKETRRILSELFPEEE